MHDNEFSWAPVKWQRWDPVQIRHAISVTLVIYGCFGTRWWPSPETAQAILTHTYCTGEIISSHVSLVSFDLCIMMLLNSWTDRRWTRHTLWAVTHIIPLMRNVWSYLWVLIADFGILVNRFLILISNKPAIVYYE